MSASTLGRQTRRAQAWAFGIQHRDALVAQYMRKYQLTERPLLRTIVDDLIEDIQGAHLRVSPLTNDRFAQTEWIEGRIEVTINSRTASMERVKHAAGVMYVGKWHESIHVVRDGPGITTLPSYDLGPLFADLQVLPHVQIVCRSFLGAGQGSWEQEFFAENAGLAAAISGHDLLRSVGFQQFQWFARSGGELGPRGWDYLYMTADDIGVNISSLVRYFTQRGICSTENNGRQARLFAGDGVVGRCAWLEMESVA